MSVYLIMGKMNCFVIIAVIGVTFFAFPIRKDDDTLDYEHLFNEFIARFNKNYTSNTTEYFTRMENFKQSLRLIRELNKNRISNSSAVYGLTEYADMSQNEFKQAKLQMNHSSMKLRTQQTENFKNPRHGYKLSRNDVRYKRGSNLPSVVDWRKKNIIGSVHNQKTCGACWAFSAIETVESMYTLKNRTFLSLSVQEVIDCAKDGNYGCEGGDACSLLYWLVNTRTKITTDKAYPFAYHTQECKQIPKVGVQVESYTCDEFIGSEDLLLQKLAYHGPVAAAVNALNWQYYLGGIIQFHCSGAPQDMNHAVQIVGYDRSGPVPYYIIRNSWGTDFGDDGYMYIAVGGNICGIANTVTSIEVV